MKYSKEELNEIAKEADIRNMTSILKEFIEFDKLEKTIEEAAFKGKFRITISHHNNMENGLRFHKKYEMLKLFEKYMKALNFYCEFGTDDILIDFS